MHKQVIKHTSSVGGARSERCMESRSLERRLPGVTVCLWNPMSCHGDYQDRGSPGSASRNQQVGDGGTCCQCLPWAATHMRLRNPMSCHGDYQEKGVCAWLAYSGREPSWCLRNSKKQQQHRAPMTCHGDYPYKGVLGSPQMQ